MSLPIERKPRKGYRPRPGSWDLRFGSLEWLQGITGLAQAVGRDEFEQCLVELLNHTLHIDTCVVFTYSEAEGPGHLFTRGRLPPDEAEELAQDYVSKYYERDPHFAEVSNRETAATIPFRPQLDDEYDPEYREHFFSRHDLVDKISTIGRVDEGNVYCNFWRMGPSGPYSTEEETILKSVLPLITSLISTHFTILKLGNHLRPPAEASAARTLVHSVISRGIAPFDRLTPREAEICERILIGYTSTGISLDLGIAVSSVNTYRRRAYEKLSIATQNELFSMCLEALDRSRV